MYCFINSVICYTIPGSDIKPLGDLIRLQSNFLTPQRITKIVIDIIQAIQSLQLHNIVHGSIGVDAVILTISSKVPSKQEVIIQQLKIYSKILFILYCLAWLNF